MIKIKNKLIKSLQKDDKTEDVKISTINFNNLNDLIKTFKLYETNISIINRKSIVYYVKMGKIIKHVKIMFQTNWFMVLKENNMARLANLFVTPSYIYF